MPTRLTLEHGATRGRVTALRYDPKGRGIANLVLAHGAGAGQEHPWMTGLAGGLAARGVRVLTFNFPYVEAGRHIPDRNDVLLGCFRAALAHARQELPSEGPLLIGGKSLGGRMASHLAAEHEPGVTGLICLGYPLHPPGRPDQLRVQHLPSIAVPTLIVQGSRDAFGSPAELQRHLPAMTAKVTLEIIQGGDHSFKQGKKIAPDPETTRTQVVDAVVRWIGAVAAT